MTVEQLTLSETQAAIARLWGTDWTTMAAKMSEYGLTPAEMANTDFLRQWSGGAVEPIYARNGETILGYNFRSTETTVGSGLNSNTSIVKRGYVGHAPTTTIETVGQNAGKVKVSRLSGIGSKVVTGASKLALPVTLASIGITLGKTIDETLYNFNPDYWNSIGLATLNPQTWSSIAGGDGSLGGSFINAIFGIDPNTGETQAYIDSNALAYMAYCMQNGGFFNKGDTEAIAYDGSLGDLSTTYTFPIPLHAFSEDIRTYNSAGYSFGVKLNSGTVEYVVNVVNNNGYVNNTPFLVSKQPFTGTIYNYTPNGAVSSTYPLNTNSITIDGVTYYYHATNSFNSVSSNITTYQTNNLPRNKYSDYIKIIYGGTIQEQTGIPGVADQTGATIPNFEGLSESDILPYLQQTYPDMFNNAINYPVVQPDGTVTNYQYVPITLPDTPTMTNTQPISGNQTQTQPSVDPATATQTLVEFLTKVLQQPMTEPINDTPNPPQNPTDTGEGSTPTGALPVGTASSLWAIYHPTQAQIDSFGAWLWSPSFLDQIAKIFNNPMESIIGLHKVYATPIDAGNSTIHVGYLDSGVASAYITQQYVYVDCGTVDLMEQFGNVFDYSPFSTVKLYLPFVGIVSLNLDEVMRSSINVNYGVDVLTGACLAIVTVSRDGNNSVLYQYSGNCAVQYPLSSGSYMGIVSSIIGVAGSAIATVATGGGVAPLALGAMGAAMNAHTSVQNSGSFSGNSGAMGGKRPYLIIERPQTKLASSFESFDGVPTNYTVSVGNCTGFIRFESVHITNVDATDSELTEIQSLLLSGVIV